MTRLVLVRHGETASNVAKRIQGSDNDQVGLTGLGHAQAATAARGLSTLRFAEIWTRTRGEHSKRRST